MKFKWVTGFFAVALLLTGCMGTGNNNEEGRGVRDTNDLENTRFNDMNRNNDITNNVSNRNRGNTADRNGSRYELSKKAADRIVKEVSEIDSAYVITTDNNAFVGAVLASNRMNDDGKRGTTNANDNKRGMTGDNGINEGRGTADDTNVSDKPGIIGDNKVPNRGNQDNVKGTNRANNQDGVGLDSMRGTREGGHDVTDDVKERITKIVQEIDGDIDNVYVSTSPDFINLAENYGNDLDNGRPVRGFFDQIGNMIERAFPQNDR